MKLDSERLATSDSITEYAQIGLLSQFVEPDISQNHLTQQRWTRVLPQAYAQTLDLFEQQGWFRPLESE